MLVKSTKVTKEAPFYFFALEHDFSRRNRSNLLSISGIWLKTDPKLFVANGADDDFCNTSRRISKARLDDKPRTVAMFPSESLAQ
jgi:hypothetical protein